MKYYEHGYSKIHPLTDDKPWDYSLQYHKAKSGKHFDVRLRRPGETAVHSWAVKRLPTPTKPAKAFRTKDHDLDFMFYTGPPASKEIKLLQQGKARVLEIDKTNGLTFKHENTTYRLRPQKGKTYNLEIVEQHVAKSV